MSKQQDRQLRDLLKKGGAASVEQLVALREAAAASELTWCEADCSKARNRSALFRSVVKAVDYPQFFGGNFEGLYDCLADSISDQRVGLVLVFKDLHVADPDIEADLPAVREVLEEVVQSAVKSERVFVYCIEDGGKHPDDAPGVFHSWSEE